MDTVSAKPRLLWLYFVALALGVTFCAWVLADHLGDLHLPTTPLVIAWKTACVVLFAVWAAINLRGRDAWLFVAVMAFGALGDAVIEKSQVLGAIPFLAGHLVAAIFYLLHRRTSPSPSQAGLALALLVGVPLIAFLLSHAVLVAVYAAGLGAMTASAWASRFPRYRVGLGAVLFAASDLLIFARMGPLHGSIIPDLLVMPLYIAGQALIAWGVVTTLLRWKSDEDLHHRL